MTFGARPFGSRSFGDSAPSDSVLESSAPPPSQTLTLPSLGDHGSIGTGPDLPYVITLATLGDHGTIGVGPTVAEPFAVTLPSLGDVGRIGVGPIMYTSSTPGGTRTPVGSDPDNRLKVYHLNSIGGARADLAQSFGRSWRGEMSADGSFKLRLLNDDTDLSTMTYGEFVQCELDGLNRFLGVIEDDDMTYRDDGEEADEYSEIRGRSIIAEWDHVLVEPSTPIDSELYGDVRLYGWMAPELDDSGWAAAIQQWKQSTTASGFGAKIGSPLGWPDPDGYWIWSTTATSSPPIHDPATSYFRAEFTVASNDTPVAIYIACDDGFIGYLEGVSLGGNGNVNGWKQPFRADVTLDADTYTLAVEGENFDRPLASTNTAGLIVAVYTIDDDGNDDTLLLRTNATDWVCLHDPAEPPGFTVGHMLRLKLEEAQADGMLSGWTFSFDDINDTNGAPWPVNQQFSFRIGQSALDALKQLAETHIDFTVDPSTKILNAYNIGTVGVPSGSETAALTTVEFLKFEGRG